MPTAGEARIQGILRELRKKRTLYLMMCPGIVAYILFNYLPLFGLVVAFKNYNFREGILRSPWVGLENFRFFVTSPIVFRAIRNTVLLNFSFILVHTLAQLAFALMLNELHARLFVRLAQSVIFLPYFISWIIVSVFVYNIFSYEFGSLNGLLRSLGLTPVDVFNNPTVWPPLLVVIDSWKWVGFGMIIYLAALTGFGPEYYEAGVIDGASRWQLIRYISIPLLLPTVTVLTLLAIGRILNSDFGMFYGIIGDNSVLFPTTDVIDTMVYRSLRVLGDVGMSSAVGLLQSVVGFILVLGSNLMARRWQEEGALF